MMTIVTHVHLKEGAGHEWDAAMRTRLSAAKQRPGWVGGQLLRQSDKPDRRVIVGTWKTRAETGERLAGVTQIQEGVAASKTTGTLLSLAPLYMLALADALLKSGQAVDGLTAVDETL